MPRGLCSWWWRRGAVSVTRAWGVSDGGVEGEMETSGSGDDAPGWMGACVWAAS